jgi:hypothetical protein
MRFHPELVELCRKEVVGSRFVVLGEILLFWNLRDQRESSSADPIYEATKQSHNLRNHVPVATRILAAWICGSSRHPNAPLPFRLHAVG